LDSDLNRLGGANDQAKDREETVAARQRGKGRVVREFSAVEKKALT
jgi:hypothetical protein